MMGMQKNGTMILIIAVVVHVALCSTPKVSYNIRFFSEVPPDVTLPEMNLVKNIDTSSSEQMESSSTSSHDSMLDQYSLQKYGWQPMALANGSRYMCHIPSPELGSDQGVPDDTLLKSGSPLPLRWKLELDAALHLAGCSLRNVGWWMYKVCWKDVVLQFHSHSDDASKQFTLGLGQKHKLTRTAEKVLLHLPRDKRPYLSTIFYNGTTCDLTTKQRQTEIRLYCAAEKEDVSGTFEISEPESCKYVVLWEHPRACVGPLVEGDVQEQTIRCYHL